MTLFLASSMASCHTRVNQVQPIVIDRQHDGLEYSPTTLLILFDPEVGKQPLLDAIEQYGAEVIYDYKMMNGMAICKPDDKTLDEAIELFKQVKGVTHVEKDRIIRLTDPVKPRPVEK